MKDTPDKTTDYQADSLSLIGAIALGTGVMIGSGIFALTGQMAEMTGSLFPLVFLPSALIVSFSAYSCVKSTPSCWDCCSRSSSSLQNDPPMTILSIPIPADVSRQKDEAAHALRIQTQGTNDENPNELRQYHLRPRDPSR